MLQSMPPIAVASETLRAFGQAWSAQGQRLGRTPPFSSGELGQVFDEAVGQALAAFLGGLAVERPSPTALTPACTNCVEVGPVRVVGGVRPQNFDVGYRPDGLRFAFDSKTLNDLSSVRKNWQNMINDLATEATTVHSRFPHAIVAFAIVIPTPALTEPQRSAIAQTLDRLARRRSVEDPVYQAEVASLVLWDPETGEIDPGFPLPASRLRIERFSQHVSEVYISRYEGLPPHTE